MMNLTNYLYLCQEPLLPAAARGGEAVSIPELKMAVVKALRVLIAKLDTKSQAKEDIFPANIKL
jgi:hypothetical protein